MNLIDQSLVSENVQSYKGERALVMPAADIDVLPVKKAHIRIPVLRALAACPDAAEHLGHADFSVEVGDRRGISSPTLNGVRTEWIRGREIEVKKAETVNRRPSS